MTGPLAENSVLAMGNSGVLLLQLRQIIGRGLIYIIIEPVGVDELPRRPLAHHRGPQGVVVGEVVPGGLDGQATANVPEVFQF